MSLSRLVSLQMVHKTLIKHVRGKEEKKNLPGTEKHRDVETSPPNLLHIQEGRVSFGGGGGGGESCEKLTSST